jgi:hypothetical protein
MSRGLLTSLARTTSSSPRTRCARSACKPRRCRWRPRWPSSAPSLRSRPQPGRRDRNRRRLADRPPDGPGDHRADLAVGDPAGGQVTSRAAAVLFDRPAREHQHDSIRTEQARQQVLFRLAGSRVEPPGASSLSRRLPLCALTWGVTPAVDWSPSLPGLPGSRPRGGGKGFREPWPWAARTALWFPRRRRGGRGGGGSPRRLRRPFRA